MPRPSKGVQRTIEAMSITYNNMVYEMKEKGVDITVLSLGEAFFDIPLFPFEDLPFPDIYHYSHSRGIIELRKKIAEYFLSEYDFNFDPKTEIIITAGSKIAIHMALMAILDPQDEVLIYEPYWVSYTEQVKLCYGEPITIPYYESIFNTEKYISKKTKCIILNNPHNPSGKIFTEDEIYHLLDLARKCNIILLSDEAYSEFIPEDADFHSLGKIDKNKEHSVICNSISKNYGMSGWRLGYIITNAALLNEILKINQHLITCPATILEHYISKHFFGILDITKPQIRKVIAHRKRVAEYLDYVGIKHLEGSAAWYLFASIEPSKLGSDEFCTILLKDHHICCVPGIGYGKSCDKQIRICVGTETWERTVKAVDKIRELIDTTS